MLKFIVFVRFTLSYFKTKLLTIKHKYPMYKLKLLFSVFSLFIFFNACTPTKKIITTTTTTGKDTDKKIVDDGKLEFAVLQLNDVYEIAQLSDGTGGMARAATMRKQLLKKYPNRVLTVLSGDFLNPSLIGTVRVNGKAVQGQQMVEVMNATGVDYVTFGNHEFDLSLSDLQKRLDESTFKWVCANTEQKDSSGNLSLFKVRGVEIPKTAIVSFKDDDGTSVNIGLFGVVLPSNPKDFVKYDDVIQSSTDAVNSLNAQKVDAIFGITHVEIKDDHRIAKANQSISVLFGGHEHTNNRESEGNVMITKADANARTVYVHYVSTDKNMHNTKVRSELVTLDKTIALDSAVSIVVDKWVNISSENFKKQGFDLDNPVTTIATPLDGRETSLRYKQTNLGTVVCKSFIDAAKKKVDVAFFNSGSIRFDDQLVGKVTQLDIIRMMPFGGKLYEADIVGSELQKILKIGLSDNIGRGGFLQTGGVDIINAAEGKFKIGGVDFDPVKLYHCIFSDFLFTGKETGLSFFNPKNPGITNVDKSADGDLADLRSDLRQVLIAYLKKNPN